MSNGKAIAVLQSNYIPWKGYFDHMGAVDEFVIFDEVQFTTRDWRNRNRIVSNGRTRWLTIPVQTAGRFGAPIDAVEIADLLWAKRHWSLLKASYRGSKHFGWFAPHLEDLYRQAAGISRLTEVNELFLRRIAHLLGLPTLLARSNEVPRHAMTPTGRLIEICQASGARMYVSGPSARTYIDASQFASAGIAQRYVSYSGYPEYEQGSEVFDHHTSVLDTLFHCGASTREHLKSLRDRSTFLEPH